MGADLKRKTWMLLLQELREFPLWLWNWAELSYSSKCPGPWGVGAGAVSSSTHPWGIVLGFAEQEMLWEEHLLRQPPPTWVVLFARDLAENLLSPKKKWLKRKGTVLLGKVKHDSWMSPNFLPPENLRSRIVIWSDANFFSSSHLAHTEV